MTVLTRRQFRQHWESVLPGLGEDGSALWAMEQYHNKKCRWFVCTRPLGTVGTETGLIVDGQNPKKEYWLWCNKNTAGTILCYSSSMEEEWWGFSHHADIAFWMLKWAK